MNTDGSTQTPWPPHLVVATIIEREGKFLLVYENDNGRKVYNQPAGHWEPNENLFEAAIRETLEETGWEVELDYIVGQYNHRSPHNNVTYCRTAFAATALNKISDKLDKEIIEAVWLSYKEILTLKDEMRSPMVIKVIDDYRNGKRYPLDLISHVR